jgi:Zn-dependent alcohol dehydrogenase
MNGRDEDLVEQVRALTGGRGADFVFVTVGSGKAMEQGLDLIRRAGTVVLVGMPASGVKLNIEAANFVADNQIVLGSKMGSTRLQIDVPKLVELYQNGRLKLDELITKRYRLEESCQSRCHPKHKLLLTE